MNIAELIREEIDSEIICTESNDPRSYRQDSTKLLQTGFKPQFGIKTAIREIIECYQQNNLPDGDNCYTVMDEKSKSIIIYA